MPSTDMAGRRRAAAASESHVAQAAREVLARGNAVDAVVAGVLVAAAESPGVLLGPVQLLAGGAGAGLLAVDGRVRQPGSAPPRPRGFLGDRADAPRGPGRRPASCPRRWRRRSPRSATATLLRAAGPALAWARPRSPERAALLEAIARRGGAGARRGPRRRRSSWRLPGARPAACSTPEDLGGGAARRSTRCEERCARALGLRSTRARGAATAGAPTRSSACTSWPRPTGGGWSRLPATRCRWRACPSPALGLVAPARGSAGAAGQSCASPREPRGPPPPRSRCGCATGIVELAHGHRGSRRRRHRARRDCSPSRLRPHASPRPSPRHPAAAQWPSSAHAIGSRSSA